MGQSAALFSDLLIRALSGRETTKLTVRFELVSP
jgi:hypothetical protein